MSSQNKAWLIFLLVGGVAIHDAAAARPVVVAAPRAPRRGLLQGGGVDARLDPHYSRNGDVTGPIPEYVVPGSGVWVVDTVDSKVGAGGGVLTNQVESLARSGSTVDLRQAQLRTRVVSNADPALRSALGGMDQSGLVQAAVEGARAPQWFGGPTPPPGVVGGGRQRAASGEFAAGAGNGHGAMDAFEATRQAGGNAMVVARGAGKRVGGPENRATLAAMDASSAVQMVARGTAGASTDHATRVGAASAAATSVDSSYWFVFVPTWW